MKSFRLFLVLSAMLLSVFCTPASATQIICLINNSSHAIKIEGTGVGAATIEYEAHGGDKNRCWHVDQSANSLDFVRTYTKNSAGQWQDSGVERFDFQNLPLGKAYWFTWSSLRHWETYIKICGKEICVYHSPNQDVWRLFVEDRK